MKGSPIKKHYSLEDSAVPLNKESVTNLIKARGKTVKQVTDAIGLKTDSLSEYTNCHSLMPVKRVKRLAKVLGNVDLSFLINPNPSQADLENLKRHREIRRKNKVKEAEKAAKAPEKQVEEQNEKTPFSESMDLFKYDYDSEEIKKLTKKINDQKTTIDNQQASINRLTNQVKDETGKISDLENLITKGFDAQKKDVADQIKHSFSQNYEDLKTYVGGLLLDQKFHVGNYRRGGKRQWRN